jgi:GTP-binding protein Era
MNYLSGFAGIVGPPNVGKSTLLNRIMGTKMSIVSPKPQTTRNRILGIYHGEGFQMIFMDTPGIHKARTPLHMSMVESARSVFQEVDVLLLMADLTSPDFQGISSLVTDMRQVEKPVFLLINKIDRGRREDLLPIMDSFSKMHPFEGIFPVSALNGDGVADLLGALKSELKPGPQFFPPDMNTDQAETFLISEIIREKIFLHTRNELPYASAVTVEEMEEIPEKNLLKIFAFVHVETPSQKGILVGKQGSMVRKIGEAARFELEDRFNARVYLKLTVRVEKNWSKDTRALRRLGY